MGELGSGIGTSFSIGQGSQWHKPQQRWPVNEFCENVRWVGGAVDLVESEIVRFEALLYP